MQMAWLGFRVLIRGEYPGGRVVRGYCRLVGSLDGGGGLGRGLAFFRFQDSSVVYGDG